MNTQEQAFLAGYLKRAAELGATEQQAVELYKRAGGLPDYTRSTSPASPNRYLPSLRPAMDVAPAPVGGYRPTPDEAGYKQIRNIAPMTAGPAPAVQPVQTAPQPPAGLIVSR